MTQTSGNMLQALAQENALSAHHVDCNQCILFFFCGGEGGRSWLSLIIYLSSVLFFLLMTLGTFFVFCFLLRCVFELQRRNYYDELQRPMKKQEKKGRKRKEYADDTCIDRDNMCAAGLSMCLQANDHGEDPLENVHRGVSAFSCTRTSKYRVE